MAALDQIMEMKNQGLQTNQIIQSLKQQGISPKEINEALQKIDENLGQAIFVSNSSIRPDGGIIEVKDDKGEWRVILVSEAKHQGKDIENIIIFSIKIIMPHSPNN